VHRNDFPIIKTNVWVTNMNEDLITNLTGNMR